MIEKKMVMKRSKSNGRRNKEARSSGASKQRGRASHTLCHCLWQMWKKYS